MNLPPSALFMESTSKLCDVVLIVTLLCVVDWLFVVFEVFELPFKFKALPKKLPIPLSAPPTLS